MFLYACGVSRVHQEFELFEQILKTALILKKSVVDYYFDDTRSQIRNVVSLALFSPLFPLNLFLVFSSLL